MRTAHFRRLLQAPDKVKLPVAAPAIVGTLLFVVAVLAPLSVTRSDRWQAAPILAAAAVIAVIATIRSAGIPITRVLPSARTGILGAAAVVLLLLLGASMSQLVGEDDHEILWSAVAAARTNAELRMERDNLPARAASFKAAAIDNAVERWVADREAFRRSVLRRLYQQLPWVADGRANLERGIKHFAEQRLAHFAGSAPAWQVTAGYCDELARGTPEGAPRIHFDLRTGNDRIAEAYTKLLGRPVTAAELAPAVPGSVCGNPASK